MRFLGCKNLKNLQNRLLKTKQKLKIKYYFLTVFFIIFLIISIVVFLFSCRTYPNKKVLLATTTSIYDCGLLDELIEQFEKESYFDIIPISVGTGEAINMGKKGVIDLILIHSKPDEDNFVEEGYGNFRMDIMYNYFVIVGPINDPAGIKGLSAIDAFKAIFEKNCLFISRGDNSGTYKKEKIIWEKANINPKGSFYIESGQGMGETLFIAENKQAYALADKGTYLFLRENLSLVILVEGDNILLNSYGIIPINPKKHKDININYKGAIDFINFLLSKKGQEIIGNFGLEQYGEPLFYPVKT